MVADDVTNKRKGTRSRSALYALMYEIEQHPNCLMFLHRMPKRQIRLHAIHIAATFMHMSEVLFFL